MYNVILTGLALGLGVGLSCAALCLPVLTPQIAARYPSSKKGLYASALFSIGRFASYLLLGVSAGVFGEIVLTNQTFVPPIILILGCLLIFQGLSAIVRSDTKLGSQMCRYLGVHRSTIVLGFLAGLRPCAVLIEAVIYSATLANVVVSVLFMTAFWLGTSVYTFAIGILTGTLTGMTSLHINMERIRRISGIALIIVGIVFLIQGALVIKL